MDEIMEQWDIWWPRDAFEALISSYEEKLEKAETHIKELKEELIDRDAKIGIYLQDIHNEQDLTKEWHQIARKGEVRIKALDEENKSLKLFILEVNKIW